MSDNIRIHMSRDPLTDRETRVVSAAKDCEKWGKIQDDPAGVAAPMTGSDQPESSEEQGKADVTIAIVERPSDIQQQDRMIGKLDHVRDLYESSKLNRDRLMVQARSQGMKYHEIGEVLGITESAVRAAIKRAGDVG